MKNKQPSLRYIKNQAKKLAKDVEITHTEALDKVAKSYGYANWIHCQRSLSQAQSSDILLKEEESIIKPLLSFTDWLKRHKNRDSPLGDLSRDMLRDKQWPEYVSLEEYIGYLHSRNAYYEAVDTLKRAWKRYSNYLERSSSPSIQKDGNSKSASSRHDLRTIEYVKGITPIHFDQRTIEVFNPGDKAWISFNSRKAIPVTIVEVDDRYYSIRVERPLKDAGEEYYFRKDEVRSTPELACKNSITS